MAAVQGLREVKAPRKTFGEKLDGVIGQFFPIAGARRSMARMQMNATRRLSHYRGAESSRTNADWALMADTADSALYGELKTMRQRSRDLVRNDGNAAGLVESIVNNVGFLKPQSRLNKDALGLTDDQVTEYQARFEDIHRKWAPHADITGRVNYEEACYLNLHEQVAAGEALVLIRRVADDRRPYQVAAEFIDPARLDTPSDKLSDPKIRHGIEINADGKPVAYWIRKSMAADAIFGVFKSEEYDRIPATNSFGQKNILHSYEQKRSGQSRGVPSFASAINLFRDLGEYREAELVAARVGACFSVFIKKHDTGQIGVPTSVNAQSETEIELQPGLVQSLAVGEEIESFNPNRPNSAFDAFTVGLLKTIAHSLGLPFEVVFQAFSGMNYSSARTALLEARRFFQKWQRRLAAKFCQPLWEILLEEAWLKGEFTAPNFMADKRLWCNVEWQPLGWQWVDPVKEVQADIMAVQNNLSTMADVIAAKGRDWEATLNQRAIEEKRRKALDLPEISLNRGGRPKAQEDNQKSEDENDKDEN